MQNFTNYIGKAKQFQHSSCWQRCEEIAVSCITGGTLCTGFMKGDLVLSARITEAHILWPSSSDSSNLICGYTCRHAKWFICKITHCNIVLIVTGDLNSLHTSNLVLIFMLRSSLSSLSFFSLTSFEFCFWIIS